MRMTMGQVEQSREDRDKIRKEWELKFLQMTNFLPLLAFKDKKF